MSIQLNPIINFLESDWNWHLFLRKSWLGNSKHLKTLLGSPCWWNTMGDLRINKSPTVWHGRPNFVQVGLVSVFTTSQIHTGIRKTSKNYPAPLRTYTKRKVGQVGQNPCKLGELQNGAFLNWVPQMVGLWETPIVRNGGLGGIPMTKRKPPNSGGKNPKIPHGAHGKQLFGLSPWGGRAVVMSWSVSAVPRGHRMAMQRPWRNSGIAKKFTSPRRCWLK